MGDVQRALKKLLVGRVRAVFNDRARGETPVRRSDDALFARDTIIWRVHGDVTTMMVGGVASLLLQMLHPAVLAGVWDHSSFRGDMLGRLRRTARFIALTTYGHRADAEAAIARVRRVHHQVRGVLPDGTLYAADDPDLLLWVHATETACFLDAWIRYAQPAMPLAEQDRYFAQAAVVARALGAVDVPDTRAGIVALIDRMRPGLRVDARTHEVARLLLDQRPPNLAAMPIQQVTFQAAVDLLPAWARHMHGLRTSPLARPIVQGSTLAIARTLRWAFT